MQKSCALALLTLTIMLGLVGLLAFTSESVHRLAEPARLAPDAPRSTDFPPTAEPTGPIFERDGLMLTY
jgi:hypothetical protein